MTMPSDSSDDDSHLDLAQGPPGRRRVRAVEAQAARGLTDGPEIAHGQSGPTARIGPMAMPSDSSDDDSHLAQGPLGRRRARTARGQVEGLASAPGPAAADEVQGIFMWPRDILLAAQQSLGDVSQSLLYAPLSMSTHFSGLGSAELAMAMVCSWARVLWGKPMRISHAYSCEKSTGLQAALQERQPGCCVFKDITRRLTDLPESLLKSEELDFDAAKAAAMASRVAGYAPCATHRAECRVPRCDFDVSGSPCRPWSRARASRNGQPRHSHKDVLLLLCWCRIILSDLPAVAVHENVEGFDVSLLIALLGHAYAISVCRVKPEDVGFSFVLRPRMYIILARRGRTQALCPDRFMPYDRLRATARRQRVALPAVMMADDGEVLREENGERAKRGMAPLEAPSRDWRYLLTEPQAHRLAQYERGAQEAAASAGQEATVSVVDLHLSSTFGRPCLCIPTLRHCAVKRMWLLSQRRWLLHAELAAAMGFPVTSLLSQAAGVPVDGVAQAAPSSSLGNAMRVASVGCAIVCALASSRYSET